MKNMSAAQHMSTCEGQGREGRDAIGSAVLDHLIEKFIDFCSQDATRKSIESKFLQPVLVYLAERFHWTLKAFQALTVLVIIQTVLLVWILIRLYSR